MKQNLFLHEKQEYLKQLQLNEDEIIRINKISEDFQIYKKN
jgi:hypothetical protein